MRRVLLLILPILIIVVVVLVVFGMLQVRSEEDKLIDELGRKAKAVAESIELSARYAIAGNDLKAAERLVESFQSRERTQGCIIYDKEGKVLAVTQRISELIRVDRPYIKYVFATKAARGARTQLADYSVYSYILPILDDQNNVLGLVEVIYDTSYLFTTLAELWKRISIALITLVLLITATSLLIHRQIFILPVRRLTQWFTRFQKEETDKLRPFEEKGEFGKLVSEVEQVALSLRVARKAVTEEAHERVKKEEIWTQAKLRDLVHAKLGDNALFVVSNREPYMHVIDEASGAPKCIRPPSGVVTAIDPILYACGGTWVAQGVTETDRKFVNSKNKLGVPPNDIHYILKRVWLTKEEEAGYYYGFANEGIWPLCHVTHTRPIFRETDWQIYKRVNQAFATKVLEELSVKSPFIFIQDYHFTLLPAMIKAKRPDATLALFWHIPWPNPEVFAICPYQLEILEGMLACDLIGFHLQYHCNNFLETVNRFMECRVNMEKFSVVRANRETLVKAFPISINGYLTGTSAETSGYTEQIDKIRRDFNLEGKLVAVGVDRIDYTKGIVERIMAIDRFLEKYPQYKDKFVFIQLASPSRTNIKSYQELMAEIEELVNKKNAKYAHGGWKPIIYLKRNFSQEEIRPYYMLGDLCIVSALHDGMNLVAKEYVAAKKDLNGVLILSRFTGASRELTDAVLINPYSIEEFADAIKFALEMSPEQKTKRMKSMRKVITENNVYRWAGNIITELTAIKKT
ncbi:MAG: trehalose-6-phosphate synthase [Deltaproteobacteria bacterium]